MVLSVPRSDLGMLGVKKLNAESQRMLANTVLSSFGKSIICPAWKTERKEL